MKRHWDNLQTRERQTVIAGAVALGILLLYALVWSPYQTHIERLEQDVTAQRETLAWMQQASREVGRLRGTGTARVVAAGGQSLLATADSTARTHGLSKALKRVQPDGQQSVRVWLEGAPFDDVMRWLDALLVGHGVAVSTLVVDPAEQPGQVDVRLVLEGAG